MDYFDLRKDDGKWIFEDSGDCGCIKDTVDATREQVAEYLEWLNNQIFQCRQVLDDFNKQK